MKDTFTPKVLVTRNIYKPLNRSVRSASVLIPEAFFESFCNRTDEQLRFGVFIPPGVTHADWDLSTVNPAARFTDGHYEDQNCVGLPILKTDGTYTTVSSIAELGVMKIMKHHNVAPVGKMSARLYFHVENPDMWNEWVEEGYPTNKDYSDFKLEESKYAKKYWLEQARKFVIESSIAIPSSDDLRRLADYLRLKNITL